MDLYAARGVLASAILNRLLNSIWLCILNLSLNHIQQRFLRYQVVFQIVYWAGIEMQTGISIIRACRSCESNCTPGAVIQLNLDYPI